MMHDLMYHSYIYNNSNIKKVYGFRNFLFEFLSVLSDSLVMDDKLYWIYILSRLYASFDAEIEL